MVVSYGAAVVMSALASCCSVFILQTFEEEVSQTVQWTAVLVALAAVWGSISSAIGVGTHALVGALKPSLPSLVSLICAGVATWLGALVVLGGITGTVGGPWLVGGLVPAVATVLTLALAGRGDCSVGERSGGGRMTSRAARCGNARGARWTSR